MKTTETQLLAHIMKCGTADVKFILDLLDSFDVEFDQVEDWTDANSAINEIFQAALFNAGIDEHEHDISIFTNCLDSHLHIDGEEMYSIEDIEKIVEADRAEQE